MKKTMASSGSLITLILGLFVSPGMVLASSLVFDSPDTCTGINCNSASFIGNYVWAFSNSHPFTLQVFSLGNECVRLDVTSQGTDLEMVLVSPNGRVWRNDNRFGVFDTRPLVKAITSLSGRGWYTLQVSHSNALGTGANFTLRYGRYNLGNVNCANPTPPFAPTEPDLNPLVDEEGVSPSDGQSSQEE